MLTSIEGRGVVVTGASKGIGKGIAKVFADRGAKVMLAARGAEALEATAAELAAGGATVATHVCDVSDWDAVQGLVAATVETFGSLDVMCANAGVFPQVSLAEMSPEDWDAVMAANLRSAFLCTKAVLPEFAKKPGGRVVLTSSITGPVTGFPGWAHYGASKAGQLGFLRTAAIELAKLGATINAVMPGNVMTEGLDGLGEDYLATMAASIPLKKIGSVADIGHAALFFASEEAGYITGQTLVVDGGQILPESLEALD
ncbi:3-oxoacyl-ACP reductase FabG [Albimonas pacifica]|uniref:3-oxoacyl-[acyl-carrier protein] reductase n=1 Tax=Albimonas pacifica TaxID=1114924 RepID=A0A1I3DDU1_9RHOB|nr:3-oxoacyl-ACP reductase FabG [Albimonas pacifica]SFH84904.1 3-oxoacyl-[acyl-carrier protein] reductase [Albimonas pacifica]